MLGKKIIQIESVDSTNNYIANLMNVGKIDHGMVILAEDQKNGKGQRGSKWSSNPGENLIFSMFLDTATLSVNNQFVLTEFVSISVCNALKKVGVDSVIKWPNDIFVNKKKIAGILIENQIKGSNLNGTIVGVGLNVNQVNFGELNATSIKIEKGVFFSVQEFVFILLNEMNVIWQFVQENNFTLLEKEYLNNLWLLNQKSIYSDINGEFEGISKGIDEIGRLIIERDDCLFYYDLKEMSFVIK
jgi:BirA family biotin operon repressor/biotin-[acetyl-CoA-carboxylase] ligase